MSIKQNFTSDALPDFRNLGVVARILLGVNALAFAAVLAAVPGWGAALERFLLVAARLEPTLAVSLVVLYALAPALARLPYWQGGVAVVTLTLAVAGTLHVASAASGEAIEGLARTVALAAIAALLLLAYLRLLTRAYSPALAEARLQALPGSTSLLRSSPVALPGWRHSRRGWMWTFTIAPPSRRRPPPGRSARTIAGASGSRRRRTPRSARRRGSARSAVRGRGARCRRCRRR
jgi:hypothetical protein